MQHILKIHPDARCDAVTHIEVNVVRHAGNLALHYLVSGTINDLRLPAVTAPSRTDELWKHTCLEAFVRAVPGSSYFEFNFSPSTEWAAYRFSDYRTGMTVAEGVAPQSEIRHNDKTFEMRTQLKLDGLFELATNTSWRIGLSAVIEETSGQKSYWALTHPPGNADFHHSDCFAIELPAASSP